MRDFVEALGLALVLAGCVTLAVVAGQIDPLLGWVVAAVEAIAVGVVLVVAANRPGEAAP